MSLRVLERIGEQFSAELPFVAYRKPNGNEVKAIFQNNRELYTITDFSESGFVFAPFDAAEPAILLRKDDSLSEIYSLANVVGEIQTVSDRDGENDRDFHLQLVKKGISEIDIGPLKKVVLTRILEVATHKSPFILFRDMLTKYPTAFCYIWYHPQVGLWLGATPEMLLETENQNLSAMSLAGTRPYRGGETPIWGKKELEEQEMVTQFIIDSLRDKVSNLSVSDRESVRAGNLWHLRNVIRGTMNGAGLGEIIRALHPTPAVCGLPKELAKDFILRNEKHKRQYYTGFLGELNFKEEIIRPSTRKNQENRAYRTLKNRTSLYVNLRCMEIRGNRVSIFVGGGITKESVPEMEWEETKDKTRTMLNIIMG